MGIIKKNYFPFWAFTMLMVTFFDIYIDEKNRWWNLFYSVICDPKLLAILLTYYKWICKMENDAINAVHHLVSVLMINRVK